MKTKKTKTAILSGLMVMLAFPLMADAQTEEVTCTVPAEIKPAVLTQADGTVEIGTHLKGEKKIQTYVLRAGRFYPDRQLDLLQDTLPLFSSNCMRVPAWGYAAGGRYPVTDTQAGFHQIVVNPETDQRVWVMRASLEKAFYTEFHLPDAKTKLLVSDKAKTITD
jgi:hypothetical protein